MRYITDEQIKKINIDSFELLKIVNDTIKHKKESLLPPKTSIHLDEKGSIFYNTMPCCIPALNVGGVKLVNRYPDNTPSLNANLMLYDLSNGQLKAVMDASYLTILRTSAVGIHSVYLFAKKDFKTIAFIGLGEVGKLALKIFIDTIDHDVIIRIFNYKNRAKEIIAEYKDRKHVTFEVYDDYDSLVNNCDVIVSAVTYQENDFTTPDKYKKGCLIVPIHTRGFMDCDLVFDKIFGDDTGHLKNFKNFNKFKRFEEICDVVNGKVKGRESDDERIIAYSVGIALHDITLANIIYEKLK